MFHRAGTYTWDGENRLVQVVKRFPATDLASIPYPTAENPTIFEKVKYEYDSTGRRIAKQYYTTAGGSTPFLTRKFAYDGWNLLAELTDANAVVRSCGWELDLSGSLQGAGGVGGMLWVYEAAQNATHFAAYDGNGNVMALVNAADGAVSALYEYGPFGEALRATGPMAKANPFRFSTKFQDEETDPLYYGYRYYDASTGRWFSRDPMEEEGGQNLYGFVNNDPLTKVDVLGAVPVWIEQLFKEAGYWFWRSFVMTAPHWQTVMDAWYYETGRNPVTYSGISDPRNQDIASNPGFLKLLNCWIAQRRGGAVPAGPWVVDGSGFNWKYVYNQFSAAGGPAAYTPATQFLGSYRASVRDLGGSSTDHNYQIDITNTSGWTSGTRLPGWARLMRHLILGIDGTSLFYNHPRGGARYRPSRGGTLVNNYSFQTSADPCATCVLP